jgi:serine/threonine protein kinase
MDYYPNCIDLFTYIHKNKNILSMYGKLLLLSNIANGLRFLKNHRIVHMDLNPRNILVGPGMLTKIIDFG